MTPDQLLTARLIRVSEYRALMKNPRDRFKFKGSTLWTDSDGITWLRDHWGYLLPVPHVRAQETTHTCDDDCRSYGCRECDECGGMGYTIGFEGPRKVRHPCETCSDG